MENTLTTRSDTHAITNNPAITWELYTRFVSFIDALPRTVESYTKTLRYFFAYLAERGITHPTRVDVIAYRDALKETHKATTVQAYMVPVRLFFRWAEQERIYPDVADRVKGAKVGRRTHRKQALTSNQARTILDVVPHDTERGLRDYAIIALMLTGGLRTIEVSRATVGDIGINGDDAVLYVKGKGDDDVNAYVKLPAPVEKAIRAYLVTRGKVADTAPLFASTSNNTAGQSMTTRSISGLVKDYMRTAGYDSDRLTAHSLRHTAATLNLLNGGTLEETQELLRHSNPATTMIYTHTTNRTSNNSEARIANILFKE